MQSLGKWAVVDEESMSTEPNAAILAIGATMIDDLEAVDRFYVNVDLQSCLDVGLHESQSTRDWWKQQSAEAFNATQTNAVPIQTALQMWTKWINSHGGKSVRLMGNGPCADNMWLNSAYKACSMRNPVPYWNDICHRTLNWIGGKWLGVTKEDVAFKGVKHHAGDDAEHEAQHAIMVMAALKDALMNNKLNGATNDMNKQEFILNNITETVRAGRVSGLVELAEQLSAVYDVSMTMVAVSKGVMQRIGQIGIPSQANSTEEPVVNNNIPNVQHVTDGEPVATPSEPVATPSEPVATPSEPVATPSEPVATPSEPVATPSEPVATLSEPVATPSEPVATPSEPVATDPANRTHDDWGLPFSDTWNVSTRSTVAAGHFKRKPGTNEEEYAHYLQQAVTAAQQSGEFKGPDNWASAARVTKYLDLAALPNTPEAAPKTLQPEAATVGQATHETVVPDAPEAAPKEFDQVRENVAAATTGASAASETPTTQQIMNAHMAVCRAFGVQDSRSKCVLDALSVMNIMQVTDEKKAWFLKASEAVAAQVDDIKADDSGEMLKMVLDSVTA